MEKMVEWGRRSGAELFIAWKYPYRGWLFVPIYLLNKRGNSYVISLEEATLLSNRSIL